MNPAEIRLLVLEWLYDRDRLDINKLPKSETAIQSGLKRMGTALEMAEIREALDYGSDSGWLVFVPNPAGGGRAAGAWRITAAGKQMRESL